MNQAIRLSFIFALTLVGCSSPKSSAPSPGDKSTVVHPPDPPSQPTTSAPSGSSANASDDTLSSGPQKRFVNKPATVAAYSAPSQELTFLEVEAGKDGKALRFDYDGAVAHCYSRGGRLPTARELVQFMVQNGAKGFVKGTDECWPQNEHECYKAETRIGDGLSQPDEFWYDVQGYKYPWPSKNGEFWTSTLEESQEPPHLIMTKLYGGGAMAGAAIGYQLNSALCVRTGNPPPTHREIVLSRTGFTIDQSNPKFANAFRDVDGRVWGFLLETNSEITYDRNLTAYQNAKLQCEHAGAKMPSKADYDRLIQQWPIINRGTMAWMFPDDLSLDGCKGRELVWMLDPSNSEGYAHSTNAFDVCHGNFSSEETAMFRSFCVMDSAGRR